MTIMQAFLTTFILLFLPFSTGASEVSCRQVLSDKTVSEVRFEKLETKFQSKFDVAVDIKNQHDDVIEYKLRIKHATDGYTVGHVQFTYDAKNKVMSIESMNVMTDFKKSGVGEVLMDQALQRFETKVITVGSLASDNHQVLTEGLGKGLSVIEAIHQTPAYKIRQKLGFTEIIPDSINSDYGFSVRKP